jgi:hypothetical protein
VLKCGGERALTKHADEIAVKTQLGLEDAGKVIEKTAELVCDEVPVICSGHVKPVQERAQEIAPVKIGVNSLLDKTDEAMRKLYDLEQSGEAEKPLKVDLNLYQMENY